MTKQYTASSDWPSTKYRSCCCPQERSEPETGRRSRAVPWPTCWTWYRRVAVVAAAPRRPSHLKLRTSTRCLLLEGQTRFDPEPGREVNQRMVPAGTVLYL